MFIRFTWKASLNARGFIWLVVNQAEYTLEVKYMPNGYCPALELTRNRLIGRSRVSTRPSAVESLSNKLNQRKISNSN